MEMILGVTVCGIAVGLLIGLTGMGGILIPPFMVILLGMDTHLAMGTSMASFLPACGMALAAHYRQGNILWCAAVTLSVVGVPSVFIGTELKACSPGDLLNLILAVLILLVGARTFFPPISGKTNAAEKASFFSRPAVKLVAVGGVVGVISGMTGAGGAVLSIPAMITLGYAPLAAIASSMLFALVISIAGTVGNVLHDAVDIPLAALCAVGQMFGAWAGLAVGRHLNAESLKKMVAWVCVFTGIGTLLKTVLGWL